MKGGNQEKNHKRGEGIDFCNQLEEKHTGR